MVPTARARRIDGRGTALTLAPPLVTVAVTALLASRISLEGGDFEGQVSPVLDALVRGDFGQAADSFPLMGPLSVLLRVPFDRAVFHSGIEVVYVVTALPCMLALAGAVLWLVRRMEAAGRSAATCLAVAALLLFNPAVVRALHWGHPEDLLCAGLLLAAALAAPRGPPVLTAVLLGLALSTKQWALLALLPIVLSAPRDRARVVAGAAALALALTLPFAIAAPGRMGDVALGGANPERFWHGASPDEVTRVTAPNVWWPLASGRDEARAGASVHSATLPDWAVAATHAALLLMVVPLSLAAWRRGGDPSRWLAVIAAVFLLRCLLDPLNFDYYHVAAIVFLGAWEGLTRARPVLTTIAVAGTALTFFPTERSFAALYEHATFTNVTYLLWMLPLAAWVTLRAAARTPAA